MQSSGAQCLSPKHRTRAIDRRAPGGHLLPTHAVQCGKAAHGFSQLSAGRPLASGKLPCPGRVSSAYSMPSTTFARAPRPPRAKYDSVSTSVMPSVRVQSIATAMGRQRSCRIFTIARPACREARRAHLQLRNCNCQVRCNCVTMDRTGSGSAAATAGQLHECGGQGRAAQVRRRALHIERGLRRRQHAGGDGTAAC